jgi:hypothetical protein
MIQAEEIIRDFQRFYSEGRGYIPATSGETWTQNRQDELAKTNETVKKYGSQWIGKKVDDCSGAFVDAYRTHNMSIYHGSNRIAREYVIELLPVSKARAGCAAFKLRKPGEDGYQLPDEYKKGGSHYNGDLNDYYHIGLIDGDGKNVINAQSTSKGFTRTPLSQWHCAARLKAVAYDGNIDEGSEAPTDDEPLYRAKVASENGKPVNMRRNPSTASAVLHEVKNGEEVEVTDVLNGWSQIVYAGENGYMMSKFLIPLDTNDAGTVSACLADIEEAKRLADRLSEIMGNILKGCGAG